MHEAIRTTLDALSEAWRHGDGVAFADWCTDDVDFINLLGMYVKGRAAVVAVHEKIFKGPYANSTVVFDIEHVRPLSDDLLVVISPSRLDIPAGPVKGIVLSIATLLFVRDGERWKIASFHNTRREATATDHIAVMSEVLRKE
jgi:uncharacterized protein (TIGR02246 family)